MYLLLRLANLTPLDIEMLFTPISEITNTDIAMLNDEHSVADALYLMEKESKHALVITGASGLRILSTQTFISLRLAGFDCASSLASLSLPFAPCLSEEQVLVHAVDFYSRQRHGLVCVLSVNQDLLGIFTGSDVLRYLRQFAPEVKKPLTALRASDCFVSVRADTPLREALINMQTSGHTSFLVYEQELTLGIVTFSDILPLLAQGDKVLQQPVRGVMSAPLISVSQEVTLDGLLLRFTETGLQRLGVTDCENRIVGLIHQHEVVTYINELMNDERHHQAMMRELSNNEQRWRAVLEGTGQGVWDWNAQTNKVYFSPVWKSMLGYRDDEIGDTLNEWESRIHPDDLESAYRDVEAHLKGETPVYDNTHRVRTRSGAYKWIRDTGKVFSRDSEGNPVRVIGSHTDITAEIELKEKLSRLAENMPGMLYQFRQAADGTASFPFASQGILDIYGCSPETAMADAGFVFSHLHPDDLPKVSASIQSSAESLKVWEQEYRYRHPRKGERWLEGRATPSRMSDGSVIWNGYIYDITDRKAQELALQHARQQAENANKAKSAFLANMSHEIRTPMSGIIGLSEISQDEHNLDLLHQRLRKIQHSGKLLLGILNDILDYSKIESGKLDIESQPFFLAGVLDNLSSLFALEADKKQLNLIFKLDPSLAAAYCGDELRIRQILTNLIGNAIKFTEQGEVSLTLEPVAYESSEKQDSQWLRFSIEDSGIGIAPEQREKLFNAFSQADVSIARKHGGSGLGLAISQRLVDVMHGRGIFLHSEPNQGSCFSFELPLTLCTQEQEASLQALQQTGIGVDDRLAGRILLVEDNVINQEIAQAQLEQLGLTVTLAENGCEALDRVASQMFDLILMDIQMPEMDGYTATRFLREQGCNIPVIALTAAAMAEDQQKARDVGMNGHLTKPIEVQALFRILSRWLPQGEHVQTAQQLEPVEAVSEPSAHSSSYDTPLFDPEEGIAMVGGQVLIYKKVLQEFARQLVDEYLPDVALMAELTPYSSADEFARAHRVAHTIKGVAGNLCMRPLAQAAADIDHPLKLQQPPSLQELQQFCGLLERSHAEVKSWLATRETANSDSSAYHGAKLNSGAELGQRLQDLMADIRNSQFIDEARLADLSAVISSSDLMLNNRDQIWQEVVEALDQFDFEKAAAALEGLLSQFGQGA